MNKLTIIGNLTRDPELSFRPINGEQRALCQVSLASNSRSNGQEKTEFFSVAFWGPVAEVIAEHTAKGSQLYVEGRVSQQRRQLTNKDGKLLTFTGEVTTDPTKAGYRSFMNVTANDFKFLSPSPKRPGRQDENELLMDDPTDVLDG